MGIAQSLGVETPFTSISGSEVYSLEMSKTEALIQALRRSIAVKIKEKTEIIEGEVVDIQINRAIAGTNKSANKIGTICLKTLDMEAAYDIGEKLAEFLQKEKITPGDIISFDKNSGKVTKLGRSYSRSYDYDALGGMTRFLNTPSGELQRIQESVHTVSLHDIDVINSRSQGFLALFSGETGEISNDVRDQIDAKIAQWRLEDKCTIIPGVLFIDECHMLDLECFSYLNRALEQDLAPIIIFATNRGQAKIRDSSGIDHPMTTNNNNNNTADNNNTGLSPHGLPFDLLDRLLIIHTEKYTETEIFEILSIRAQEEEINITPQGLQILTTTAVQTGSLRYALNLLSMSLLVATKRQKQQVEAVDINKAYNLFIDQKRSCDFLNAHAQQI